MAILISIPSSLTWMVLQQVFLGDGGSVAILISIPSSVSWMLLQQVFLAMGDQ